MKSIDVIKSILALNPDIAELSFHEYPRSVLVQSEMMDWGADEQDMFEMAIELKKEYGLPFWNGIMLSSFDNPHYSKKILNQSLRHNSIVDLCYISRERIHSSLNPSFAFCSKVKMSNGSIKHIPQLDFHISPSPQNLRVVCDVCQLLNIGPGWILDSGESYHFIGRTPVSWERIKKILYTAIVFNPIIDTIWISHQLREGCCSLRIGEKRGVYPTVICQI